MTLFKTPAEDAAYKQGYRNGESSGYADWVLKLTEEFDLGPSEIVGPAEFVRLLRTRYTISPILKADG